MIAHIAVLVPARDEQDRIEHCLRSVVAAGHNCPVGISVSITVVADGCLDDTALVARRIRGVDVVETESTNVGTARRAAAEHALHALDLPASAIWLANTDADSVVPANWLSAQLSHADAGADVVIGTVKPDPDEYPAALQLLWEASHIRGRPNGHVHGANLGIRASAYLEAGGYRPLPEHEDVDLVKRLAHRTHIATDEAEVITSGRLVGRTAGGYAGYLRALASRSSTGFVG